MTEFSQVLDVIQNGIATLNERFTVVEQRITGLEQRMDQRFAAIDQRFAAIDQRFVGVDQRLLGLDDRMSRQFYWIVGVQVTTFVATIAAFITALLAR